MGTVTMIPAKKRVGNALRREDQPKKLKIAAYCRVSTDSDEQATSYEAQIAHYTELIGKNPAWEMAGVYADDGISGTNTRHREEFNRMIDDAMAGRIDMIVSKSISRFARNTLDCLKYIRKLKEKNIPVFFEKENLNTMDATSEVLLTIMASLAQQESQSLSQNVKLGLQYRYQQGKVQVNHNWFLGYTKNENGSLVIDPEQAEVVRRIYREYLEGASMTQIARGLETDGILTGAGRTRWYNSTVNKILRNEKYYGDALLQKTYTTDFLTKSRVKNEGIVPQYYVQGDHEPIISKEMFLLVQEEIARRQAGKKDVSGRTSRYSTCHCFSHIVYCDKCGGLFRRVHWNNHGCKSIVWRCSNRLEKAEEKCMARTVREDDLESIVLRAINETFCQSDDFMSALENNVRMVAGSKSGLSLKALDEKIASLQRKLVEKVNHRENYEDLVDQIQRLQAEKALRESDGANKKRNVQVLHDLQIFIRSQGKEITEFDEKLVRRLVERIMISDETVTVLFKSGQSITIHG